jgi:hypothetical protein
LDKTLGLKSAADLIDILPHDPHALGDLVVVERVRRRGDDSQDSFGVCGHSQTMARPTHNLAPVAAVCCRAALSF